MLRVVPPPRRVLPTVTARNASGDATAKVAPPDTGTGDCGSRPRQSNIWLGNHMATCGHITTTARASNCNITKGMMPR